MLAIEDGHRDIAQFLASQGSDISSIQDMEGHTAYDLAIKEYGNADFLNKH